MPWTNIQNSYHQIIIRFPFGRAATTAWPLPVPPPEIKFQNDQVLRVYSLISLGETLGLGGRKLERIGWSSHFCRDYDPSVQSITLAQHNAQAAQPGLSAPEWWIECFRQTQKRQKWIELTISNTPVSGWRMAIQSFKHNYIPGPSGDIWYDITLIEHRQTQLESFAGDDFPRLRERPRPFLEVPSTFTVRNGESLYDISIIFYYSREFIGRILRANVDLLHPTTGRRVFDDLRVSSGDELDGTLVFDPEAVAEFTNDTDKITEPLPNGSIITLPEIDRTT